MCSWARYVENWAPLQTENKDSEKQNKLYVKAVITYIIIYIQMHDTMLCTFTEGNKYSTLFDTKYTLTLFYLEHLI